MNIDLVINELKRLKREGADRVYVKDPSAFGNRFNKVSKIDRDREGDALIR